MAGNVVFQLNEDSDAPIFLNLASVIIREIERGRLKPGSTLPGTRTLSKSLGVHRNTVDAAYKELILQGWIVARPSRGCFVAEDLPLAPSSGNKQRRPGMAAPRRPTARADEGPLLTFSDGTPDPRIMPRAELARAFRRALSAPAFLHGSAYGDPRGSLLLREALCDYLGRERGLAVSADDIVITRGGQMAVYIAARVLLQPGDVVAVEDPGFPLAWSAFRATGARVVGIPVDPYGLVVQQLEKIAERETRLRAVYVTPHHQYPTTVTLGAGRRLALLDLARRRRLTLIEEDYDHEYQFDGRPVLPLTARAASEVVLYVGSFSKLLAPGIRLGYLIVPGKLRQRMADQRETIDRQGDLPLEHAVAALMQDGELRRHARKSRRIYQARRDLLAEELRRRFGTRVSFDRPPGGLAIWLRLMDGANTQRWASRAASMGLAVLSGARFALNATSAANAFRLGYANLNEDELRRAVDLLVRSAPWGGDYASPSR